MNQPKEKIRITYDDDENPKQFRDFLWFFFELISVDYYKLMKASHVNVNNAGDSQINYPAGIVDRS